ncbi:MAG TPA: signal peptidase II [Deltaproteobacteria bacterium]|nr:signal peptidase II [Deltaproteobacteria bacterium]
MTSRTGIFSLTTLTGVALDQLTKRWVIDHLEPMSHDEIVIVPDLLSIVHARNTGAAFSMMEGAQALFLAITVVAIVIVTVFLYRLERDARFEALTLGMVFGGILGNGIDRLLYRSVTDMVKCYVGFEPVSSWLIEQLGTNVYPIWNVADALLVVGVSMFLLRYALQGDSEPRLEEDDPNGVS